MEQNNDVQHLSYTLSEPYIIYYLFTVDGSRFLYQRFEKHRRPRERFNLVWTLRLYLLSRLLSTGPNSPPPICLEGGRVPLRSLRTLRLFVSHLWYPDKVDRERFYISDSTYTFTLNGVLCVIQKFSCPLVWVF